LRWHAALMVLQRDAMEGQSSGADRRFKRFEQCRFTASVRADDSAAPLFGGQLRDQIFGALAGGEVERERSGARPAGGERVGMTRRRGAGIG